MEIFTVIFMMFFAFAIFSGISRFIDNENSPIVSEEAYVKRKINDTHIDANGASNTTLMIVFTVNSKDIKCHVRNRIYRGIPKDTYGVLTHKGTRFIKFEFDGQVVEK